MSTLQLTYSVPGGRFPVASLGDAARWVRAFGKIGEPISRAFVTGTRDGVPFVKRLQTQGNQ